MQPVVLTPFLLMAPCPGHDPVRVVQQLAEALSGIALAQLIRPGCPVIFGSFCPTSTCSPGRRASAPEIRHRAAVHGQLAGISGCRSGPAAG